MGPLRLNLSKSGLGLSGGVTGARVGLGPKGPYVHGGRHGMYYRKFASRGKATSQGAEAGEQNFFVDTGLTFRPGNLHKAEEMPSLAETPKRPKVILFLMVAAAILMLAALSGVGSAAWVMSVALLAFGVFIMLKHRQDGTQARETLQFIEQGLEDKINVTELLGRHQQTAIGGNWRFWMDDHLYACYMDAFFEDPDYILPAEVEALEQQLVIPPKRIAQIKLAMYAAFVDAVIEDHMISAEEEDQLRSLQKDLRIHDEGVAFRMHLVRQLAVLRDTLQASLDPQEVDISLKRGEVCYHQTVGRFLKERIMNQFQRNRIRYKEIGYDTDMEGDIYLTNSRILIVGEGSRSYPVNRVLDTTLSIEDHTLHLVLDNRKTPLIISVPDLTPLAAKIQVINTTTNS